MSIPRTTKAFRRTEGDLPRTIVQTTEAVPSPDELGPHDVLIKVRAVSLNYRDVAMLNGLYPVSMEDRGIPCSDCAAEVVAIGKSVQDFALGDRVAPIFDVSNFTGLEDEPHRGLGGDVAGVLREYAVFEDKVLVKLPEYLTWEEVCGSPGDVMALHEWLKDILGFNPELCWCYGVASPRWPQDEAQGPDCPVAGNWGTTGTKAIITSSSDEKLEAVKKLGPDVHGINYKTTASQKDAVLEITNGKGVDFVINNTGPSSIPEDLGFLRTRGGTVSLVGFLAGFGGTWEPSAILAVMQKVAKIQGIAVGSKEDYQEMNKFLEEKSVALGPIIDRVFSFDESEAAFDYLFSGKHTGKIVIKL